MDDYFSPVALFTDNFVGAFAVASLLAALALVTLVLKTVLEWRFDLHSGARH